MSLYNVAELPKPSLVANTRHGCFKDLDKEPLNTSAYVFKSNRSYSNAVALRESRVVPEAACNPTIHLCDLFYT